MSTLIILPIIIPLFTAIVALLAGRRAQRSISLLGTTALLAASIALLLQTLKAGYIVLQVGDWPAPFGISFVVDIFGAIMVLLAGIMGFATALFSWHGMDADRLKFGYAPLFNILLMGVNGAFITGDIFNMYVWFEVLLISSFVLMVLGGEKPQLEGAIKYVTLNLISSTFFLFGIAMIYSRLGTLNFADLAFKIQQVEDLGMLKVAALFFLAAFGIKAAVFPLYFWLPASYHTPPAAVSAIFAGLLTKVGVYALIRVFTLIFIHDMAFTHNLLLIIAGFTMFFGVIGAAVQYDFRRILSFHIISQIGYMVMGLGFFTKTAIAGAIFFIFHNIIAKSNLFLISGLVEKMRGTNDLKKLGGLYKLEPLIAILFIIPAFSLAGIPPLSGFWAKFLLVKAGLELEGYFITFIALFVSLLTFRS